MGGGEAMSPTKHRADDRLLLDGQPRSVNRNPRRSRSKSKPAPVPQLDAADAELREQTIRSGDVFVTKLDGTTEVRSITATQRSGSVRGKRKAKTKPATPRDRELTTLKPTTPAKTTTKGKRSKSRKRSVDPYATTAKADRPLTVEQRSELAALARDPYMNFDNWQTLTRGQAERLIPRLQKLAKQRSDAHLSKRKLRRKQR
jgi:hypothetical protein